jgi:hypothetical protein
MKAAVINNFFTTPRYEDFPEPVPGEGEILIQVKALFLKILKKESRGVGIIQAEQPIQNSRPLLDKEGSV